MSMNYEDMSDFEINKLVAVVTGEVGKIGRVKVSNGKITDSSLIVKDYCNSPSDAWGIIVENDMTVGRGSNFNMEGHLWKAFASGNISHADKNPLRAAMICFLKMKDAEK